MAASEIPRPGTEVLQELRTQTPTIFEPTLAPCVIGVCKQILEVTEDDGTLNSDAMVAGPALATAPSVQNYALDGLTLQVSVNNGPTQSFTFSGTVTAAQAASQILAATVAPVGFTATTYTDGSGVHLQLKTLTTGQSACIKIVGGTGLTVLGWNNYVGYVYYGIGYYTNRAETILQTSLPDPRDIIEEVDVDEDSVRVFIDLSTEIREILRTESFLRKGVTAAPVDDGDGDTTTPYINLNGTNLLLAGTAATVTGTVDLGSPGVAVHGLTLDLALNGAAVQSLKFVGQPLVSTNSTGWTWTNIQNGTLILSVNGTSVTVTFSPTVADLPTLITEINAAVATAIGVGTVVAYRAGEYGQVDVGGTYLGMFFGGAPPTTVANTSVSATGGTAIDDIMGGSGPYVQLNYGDKLNPSQPIDDIEAQIDKLWGGNLAAIQAVTDYLVLTSTRVGSESKIDIRSSSTALTALGLTAAITNGGSFPMRVGDYIYGDGAFLGAAVEINALGLNGRVKMDREIGLTPASYATWYVISKNLDTVSSSQWGVTVPTPDFYVTTQGNLMVKHDFLRDTTGAPVVNATVGMYIAYDALRLDVTPEADEPALLAFDNEDDLDEAIGPITPDNPLAFGIYLSMLNAPNIKVYGIGVPEISDDKPYGTIEGYQTCCDFLESQGVYAVAPMTSDNDVVQVVRTHVLAMSEPAAMGERVLIFHLGRPTRESDTIVASGTDGDRVATGPAVFDTKLPTLSQALLAAGVDPTDIVVADGVFIDIATDAYNWNVTGSVTDGTKLTVNTVFTGDENVDGFYSEGTFPAVISDTFSVKIRGAAISSDKDKEIETIINRGEAIASRRCWMQQCDQVGVTVDGVEMLVPGFFFCAAKAGAVAGQPPAQGFTEFPIAGFTRVTGSNDIYSPTQLNQGAGGGADWVIQEGAGTALKSRHQVTTDPTSVETMEQSITKQLDYGAYFIRRGYRFYIGRFNISDTFLDSLSAVSKGLVDWLINRKAWRDGRPNNILQDSTNPTRVLVDINVLPYYPCNYIRVTLVV